MAEIQAEQQRAQQDLAKAREAHRERLAQWIGRPQKNHVRVLLCTLPDVLWPDSGAQRMGMLELMEP